MCVLYVVSTCVVCVLYIYMCVLVLRLLVFFLGWCSSWERERGGEIFVRAGVCVVQVQVHVHIFFCVFFCVFVR